MFLFPDPWEGRLSRENARGVSGGTVPPPPPEPFAVCSLGRSGQQIHPVLSGHPNQQLHPPPRSCPSQPHLLRLLSGHPPLLGWLLEKSSCLLSSQRPLLPCSLFGSSCLGATKQTSRLHGDGGCVPQHLSPQTAERPQEVPVYVGAAGGATVNCKQASGFLNSFSGPLLGLGRKNKGPVGAAPV